MAVSLALAAMALRALLPVGFMPSPADAGLKTPLVICTMAGPATLWLDAAGKPAKPDPESHGAPGHAPCAFAGFGALLAAPQPAILRAPIASFLAPVDAPTTAPPGQARDLRLARPRAPPVAA